MAARRKAHRRTSQIRFGRPGSHTTTIYQTTARPSREKKDNEQTIEQIEAQIAGWRLKRAELTRIADGTFDLSDFSSVKMEIKHLQDMIA
jgi:hypothetical protein